MNKLTSLMATAVLGVSATAMAADVPNSFSSGEVISAAKMNANFTELESGVNDNAALITALTQRIAALESNQSGGGEAPTAPTLADAIDGQSFKLHSTYSGFFGQPGDNGLTNYVRYLQGHNQGTLSFNNGVFSLQSSFQEHEGLTTPTFCPQQASDGSGCVSTPGNDRRIEQGDESEQGSYSVNESTAQVTLTFGDGEELVFQATMDGYLMYHGDFYTDIRDNDQGERQEQREISNTMLIRMPAQAK